MLAITGWPRDAWSLFDQFEPILNGLNKAGSMASLEGDHWWSRGQPYPLINVWKVKDDIVLDAEMPGVKPSDIDVSVNGAEVVISGRINISQSSEKESVLRSERPSGEFSRRLKMPFRIDSEAVKASYTNGILRLTLPRIEDEKPQKIAIQAT